MGGCFSARFKTERQSPSHNGLTSNVDDREDDILIGLSSMATSSSMLQTSRTLKCFTLKEIKTATRNLVPDNQLSEDEFCCVKGWIDEHTLAPTKPGSGLAIAVKKLNKVTHKGGSEWLRKINNMGQLHHPNLVKLIGYCLEDDYYPILVYEFVTMGSLDNHLFRTLDAAKGLAFLHSNEVKVIHGDFKTSNILIDSNYSAKLFDFGLDKYRDEEDVVNMLTRATILGEGCVAPEYLMTGMQTKRFDIYRFGVVLLEIMSGKCAVDRNRPECERSLIKWAIPLLGNKHKIFQVMDSYIEEGQYSLREAIKVAKIAVLCLSTNPLNGPNIDEVVRSLEQINDIVGGMKSFDQSI